MDFINESKQLSAQTKQNLRELFDSEDNQSISFRKLTHINLIIKNNIQYSSDNKRIQSLKSYDHSFINYILEFQKKNKLSNTQIALKFKSSRNTIAKWNRNFTIQ